MAISEHILAIRFGYGVRPGGRRLAGAGALLRGLAAPDPLARRFARPGIMERIEHTRDLRAAKRDGQGDLSGSDQRYRQARQKSRQMIAEDMRAFLARAALSDNGFRERLVAFWADHFTVSGRNAQLLLAIGAYLEEAIRPNIAGRFADILKATLTHPAMLVYLDQVISIGPGSPVGQRRGKGLNENLAREVLELHTLGVGSNYTQTDVRQFAELLTGLRVGKKGFKFDARIAEPGAETILGRSYGGGQAQLQDIDDFLEDLAMNPQTAAHISRKLATHFIADDPPPALVGDMTDAYLSSGGELLAVYRVLLEHPASTGSTGQKVKWPAGFMVSAIRALNVSDVLAEAPTRELHKTIITPMQVMGQTLFRPPGPDGWSENAEDWVTPSALAARIEWAAGLARKYGQDSDPRRLLETVLGDLASPVLTSAVAGAENKWEGVALMLISPEFNRR